MSINAENNKAIVRRFNKECIEEGRMESFEELLAKDAINHSAQPGAHNGPESFYHFLNDILRKAFSELRVEILEQVAENDLVTTRKKIYGKHSGQLFDIPPTNKNVIIHGIDIIRLKDGRYAEHWGQSNFSDIVQQLKHQ
ncbi:MAG: ester cyclase [Flavipsychrobacter sp.]